MADEVMEVKPVPLLAFQGKKYNQRWGRLGKLLHGFSKQLIRRFVKKLHKRMYPVIEYKRENGWIKDHVAAMDEGWQWVISLDDMPINQGQHQFFGFTGPDDVNRVMFIEGSDIVFSMLDEDSHYDIRVLLWLKWIYEHWDRFEISAERAYQLMNFGNLYKDLLSLNEPLPQDDGKDEVKYDYLKAEKNLLKNKGDFNGLDNTG